MNATQSVVLCPECENPLEEGDQQRRFVGWVVAVVALERRCLMTRNAREDGQSVC